MILKTFIQAGLPSALALLLWGCAFNVVSVKRQPATFSPAVEPGNSFVLLEEVKVKMGTGYPTILKSGPVWRHVGQTELGEVYRTQDQIVKVEASNIYEAFLVVSNDCLVGFYLPVEQSVSPLASPIPLPTQTNNEKRKEKL